MTTWIEVTAEVPDLAARAQARFEATGLALVATLRRDGSPRISGVEPFFGLGELWLGMMPGSRKAADLLRDGRCALHAATIDKEVAKGDAKLSGAAIDVHDADIRAAYAGAIAEAAGGDPSALGDFSLFRVDVRDLVMISLAPERDALHVEHWSPDAGYTLTRRT